MCMAQLDPTNPNSDLRKNLRDIDPTNPYSDLRLDLAGVDDNEEAKRRYNAAKNAAQAAQQEKETLAARAAYSTRFDAISEAARGMRQRYAQTLGYNPYFIR